jgi:molybdopterin/thiamine biosynthesis adenylyltransferase
MGLRRIWHRLFARRSRAADVGGETRVPERSLDVRMTRVLFDRMRTHVEDFTRGEEAGFLICSLSRLEDRDVLLAREWMPIPDRAISRGADGSVLSWSAEFNNEVLERAVTLDAAPVLVHSHGSPSPAFSPDDRRKERPLFGTFSKLVAPLPTGTLLLGRGDAAGSFWLDGRNCLRFRRLVIVGERIEAWDSVARTVPVRAARERLNRQNLAIGPESDAQLASATVAVVGVSGGGSHVVQQLAHQGIGTLIAVDDQTVDESNLGRLVGATEADIDKTLKVDLARRVATGIDSSIEVLRVVERFPSKAAIDILRQADVVVACLDRFDAREAINAFCRRYLIPLVDIGMEIRSAGERLARADGQLIVSLPGHPCMRCWFLTDADLEQERQDRPAGYDRNPNAPGDPQVVSMNGVLASEACNCVLDLITGYSGGRRGAKIWQYEGRTGQLEQCELPSDREDCPACAEEGCGDPSPLTHIQTTTEV